MSTEQRDVTDREPFDSQDSEPSRRPLERGGRIAAVTVGGTIAALGLRRRSLGGAIAALAGGWLLYRGLVGGRSEDEPVDTDAASGGGRPDAADASGAVETTRSVTIGASPDEVYERWRDPETMSRLYGGLLDVTARDEDRWNWTASGPLGATVSWDTQVVDDSPGERLRWESHENAPVSNEGQVSFREAPGDRGTKLTFRFRFEPPGGSVGTAVTKRLEIVPESLAAVVLDRFKSLVETGEMPTLERNPSARGAGDLL
ncbi:SRPBCC family protein [Natrinema salsiterrestre]|uniref:SRPBCC family protein n=1 Tax=Natrinema salsiterrestre TaxID=2950540 RepID=A0A9Q4L6Z7_9EURY|nr:SRPBCC family protein [Natrinema salsiterrestre]MDF9747095.1 SRPBCC family protein [Natrinema salsiterrestre]